MFAMAASVGISRAARRIFYKEKRVLLDFVLR